MMKILAVAFNTLCSNLFEEYLSICDDSAASRVASQFGVDNLIS